MEVLACIGVIAIIAGLGFGGWKAFLWIKDVNFELSQSENRGNIIFELRSDMRKTHSLLSELVALNELQQPNMLSYISPELMESEVLNFCEIMYDGLDQFYPENRYSRSKDTTVYKRINAMKNENS